MISFINQVLAVVVLYKQDYKTSITLISLNKAVRIFSEDAILDVYIYDNSPEEQNTENQFKNLNFYKVLDIKNPGVSKAYNEGAKYANQHNKKWLFLLDQDTNINEEYFFLLEKNILKEVNCYMPVIKSKNNIISPCYFYYTKGIGISKLIYGKLAFGRYNFINSGTFVALKSFINANGYNEKIPFYFSDFDFFERLKKIETHFFQLNVIFEHSLSSSDDSNYLVFLKKFELYYIGFKQFINCNPQYKILGFIFVLLRTAKHSFKHKTFDFIRIIRNSQFEH